MEKILEFIRGLQRPLIACSVVGVVVYSALLKQDWAQAVIESAVIFVVGHLFGERSALKRPGGNGDA